MYFATGDLCRQAGQRDAHTMDLQPFFCERPDNLSVEELHRRRVEVGEPRKAEVDRLDLWDQGSLDKDVVSLCLMNNGEPDLTRLPSTITLPSSSASTQAL